MALSLNFDLGVDNVDAHLGKTSQFTIGDIVRKTARLYPDRPAVVTEHSHCTYRSLNDRVNRLANALAARGIEHGSRLAVISENRQEYAEILYAGAKLGALVPCINWRLAREELTHCLHLADPDIVFLSATNASKQQWIMDDDPLTPDIVWLDDSTNGLCYDTLLDTAAPTEPRTPGPTSQEDGLAVLYTSGTTGLPKGAVISHRAFLARIHVMENVGVITPATPDFIAWAPMFHMASTDPLFAVGYHGGTYFPIDGFDVSTVVERLRSAENAWLQVMPGTYEPIFEYAADPGIPPAARASVQYIGSMPDLVPPEKVKRLTEVFEARHLNSFGSTETGFPPATNNSIPCGTHPTTDDIAKTENQLCRVKLVDEDGATVHAGEIGELLIQGPTLFSGYLANPDANAQAFTDGWFGMGDMFIRNDDGSLTFINRKKYLIKSGGENIYPAEIETPLLEHPAVLECVAVRVPDDKWGEVPKVYLATSPDRDFDETDVVGVLDGEIARYKLPHYVEFVPHGSFPRSTTGEIIRGEVETWGVHPDQRVRNP